MKKMLIVALATAAALIPAGAGLAANPSLSAKVPVPAVSRVSATHDAGDDSVRLRVSDDGTATDGAHRNRHSGDDDAARAVPRGGATRAAHDAGDDKGGRRKASSSDDGVTHDAGDDKGGQRKASSSDDGAAHDAGDDHGGSTEAGDDHGGRHGGQGGHGGHGSDD